MIAVVGEALIDAHLDRDVLRLFPGGGPYNTAFGLARLGIPVRYLGAISCDALGCWLEQNLRSAGVDTTGTKRVSAPTPFAIVERSRGEPSYRFYLNATAHEALRPDDLNDLPERVAALHVGTLALATDPPASAVAAFAEYEARRQTLMLDPNVRPGLIGDRDAYVRRFEWLAAVSDLVKLSTADRVWLYPDAESEGVAEWLLGIGAGCVVETDGADGAQAWTRSESVRVAAPDVTVVDTIGAGDAFGAGLLAWLWRSNRLSKQSLQHLRNSELEDALAYAAATGAAQCTRASAWGPTATDVERLLDGAQHPAGRASEEDPGGPPGACSLEGSPNHLPAQRYAPTSPPTLT